MKTILLASCMLASFLACAQIVITGSDMPSVNDTVRYSTSTTDVNDLLNTTGEDVSWDFSSLVPDWQDMASFRSVLSINPIYLVSFLGSSFGQHDANLDFTAATATDVYRFYSKSPGSYAVDGRGFTLNGAPLSQTYMGKDILYKFPLTYGQQDSNSYTSNEVNVLIATLKSSGTRMNTVDGWGMLTTPFGTYPCIRVKSVVKETDEITIASFPIGLPITRTHTEYKWIGKDQKIPLLEVDVATGVGAGTTITYRDIPRPELFADLARFSANKTSFITRSKDTCILTDQSAHSPASVEWEITPATFTYTGGTGPFSKQAKVFFLAGGEYTVKLKVHYNAGDDDTTITDYIHVSEPLISDFGISNRSPQPGETIQLFDLSSGLPQPTQWVWSITPNTFTFVDGSSPFSQNPKIRLDQTAAYTVSLNINNGVGTQTTTRNNYINAHYVGIDEAMMRGNAFTLYPNPAHDHVELKAEQAAVDHISCYDITGKMIAANYQWTDRQTCVIDCAGWAAGVYVIKITDTQQHVSMQKISVR